MYLRLNTWMVALLALGFATPTLAQEPMITDSTPRNWVLELQLGSFHPSVDEKVRGAPFDEVFDGSSLLTQLALQRLVYQGIGTLGIGVQAGYSEFYGRAFLQNSNDRSGDTTSLHVIPIQLFAAYRFDYAAIHWNFPFAVYGKAGVGEWIWWSNDGSGATAGDGDASGSKLGFSLTAGAAFHLDWLDPKLAREFDRNFGVNNTYLFVEYARWNAKFRGNLFKHGIEAQGLDFSDSIVSGGMAFEF